MTASLTRCARAVERLELDATDVVGVFLGSQVQNTVEVDAMKLALVEFSRAQQTAAADFRCAVCVRLPRVGARGETTLCVHALRRVVRLSSAARHAGAPEFKIAMRFAAAKRVVPHGRRGRGGGAASHAPSRVRFADMGASVVDSSASVCASKADVDADGPAPLPRGLISIQMEPLTVSYDDGCAVWYGHLFGGTGGTVSEYGRAAAAGALGVASAVASAAAASAVASAAEQERGDVARDPSGSAEFLRHLASRLEAANERVKASTKSPQESAGNLEWVVSAEAVSAFLELGFPQCAVGSWAAAPPVLVCRLETVTFLNGYEALATGPTAGESNEFRPPARSGGWRAGLYDPSLWSLHFDSVMVSFPIPRAPGASAIEPPEAPLLDCRGLGVDDEDAEDCGGPRRSPSILFQRIRKPASGRRAPARNDILKPCWKAVALRGTYKQTWEDASEDDGSDGAAESAEGEEEGCPGTGDAGAPSGGPCNEQAFRIPAGTAGATRADVVREAVSRATSIAVRVDLCTVLLSASHSQFAQLLRVVDMIGIPPPGAPTGGASTAASGVGVVKTSIKPGTFTVIGVLCDEGRVIFHQASPAQLAAAVCSPPSSPRRVMSAYAALAAMKRSYAFLISGLCLMVASPDVTPSAALAASPSEGAPSLRVWLTAAAVSLLEARHEPGAVAACAHLGRRAASPPALLLHRIVCAAAHADGAGGGGGPSVPVGGSVFFRDASTVVAAAASEAAELESNAPPVVKTDDLPMLSIFFCRDELPFRRTEAVIAVGEAGCCCKAVVFITCRKRRCASAVSAGCYAV